MPTPLHVIAFECGRIIIISTTIPEYGDMIRTVEAMLNVQIRSCRMRQMWFFAHIGTAVDLPRIAKICRGAKRTRNGSLAITNRRASIYLSEDGRMRILATKSKQDAFDAVRNLARVAERANTMYNRSVF